MNLGSVIRASRQRAGLTQARLARRAQTSQAAISDYEAGKRVPEPDTLARIMRAVRALPSAVLNERRADVLAAASAAGVSDLRVFGSVARGEDGPDSDIDFIALLPDGMLAVDFVKLCNTFEAILGTRVDVVDERAVPVGEPLRADALAV